jgi:lysophosphatidate acyltransferase
VEVGKSRPSYSNVTASAAVHDIRRRTRLRLHSHETAPCQSHVAHDISQKSGYLARQHTTPHTMFWLLYILSVPAAVTMFLRLLSLVLPPGPAQLASFAAFTLTSFALLLACTLYGVFASIALRLVRHGGMSQWTTGRSFKWAMWWATGVRFNITGSMKREGGVSGEDAWNMRPVVFVGNHQTEMDVLMLGTMFPKWCSVTAKKSLKWTPFLGWFSAY